MPYTINEDGPADKPFCVYRQDADGAPTGDTLGCHATEDEAGAQIGAIESNEGEQQQSVKASTSIVKQFDLELLEHREDGGKVRITTPTPDRIGDRVMPMGAQLDDYRKNPIVQYGHNYADPWATIGKTNSLETSEAGVVVDFTLRPAANEADPQNIVRLLWAGKWIQAASVGILPKSAQPNAFGGNDYSAWELLEWSLVPVPMNAQALSMAQKAVEQQPAEVVKEGRVISAKDHARMSDAIKAILQHAKDLQGYLSEHAPPEKALENPEAEAVTITTNDTQTVTPTPEFQALSDDALATLKEFQNYLKEVKL